MEPHGIPGLPDDYDWDEAVACASIERCRSAYPLADAGVVDIYGAVRAVAHDDGQNDGADWIAVLELADGRYALIAAWCDYTGWDCQSGASDTVVADSLEDLVRLGMSRDEAARLGLSHLRDEVSR